MSKKWGAIHKYPPALSGGQRQRVALARALAVAPKVLLLDEPLSHVDAWQREQLREELKQIQQKTGVTTIYVTHDHLEARMLADRISVLHRGRIEQTEPPEEVFYQPKTNFVAHFVGVTNILNGSVKEISNKNVKFQITGTNSSLIITVKKYPIFEEKKTISLCLHPEKIILSPTPKEENHFLGKVVDIKLLGMLLKVTLNVDGLRLEAIAPRERISSLLNKEKVWVCFASNALHPLCGRCHRLPFHLRKCQRRKI